MYKTMLVPLDGSRLAEVVFAYARELAGRLDLDLVFLHVSAPEESELMPMHQRYIEHAAETVRCQSEQVQEQSGAKPGTKCINARGEVISGYPADVILRHAEKNKVDLILMATHGHSGITRWVMGSVADKVLRASRVPVLLVRAGITEETIYDTLARRTILVPLDGSPLAETVLPHVETVAKQRRAELTEVVLLRILELQQAISQVSYYLTQTGYPPTTPLKWEDFVKQEMQRAEAATRDYLTQVAKRLQDSGIRVRTEVVAGKAADEIINYAAKNPVNLIIMSTHGRSGLSRWAYGSVTEKILYGVNTPVLLVRPQKAG